MGRRGLLIGPAMPRGGAKPLGTTCRLRDLLGEGGWEGVVVNAKGKLSVRNPYHIYRLYYMYTLQLSRSQ